MPARPRRRRAPAALVLAMTAAALGAAAVSAAPAPAKPLEAKLDRLEGGKLKLSELRGQPVLLELWATWCMPCREQAEIVRELAAELAGRSVAVLAVNQGEGDKVVQKYLAEHPSHYPVVLDRWQVVSAHLQVNELPALVLLDRDGKVAGLRLGLTRRDDLLSLLRELENTAAAGAAGASGRQ
ncbi:MAG TPA: TlpA disulfide reductase family protein [Thermoanaerobaculia bacterium]|nr:TlpA disulfide reductase family protein [Thermoanaerobaculia bacterium]